MSAGNAGGSDEPVVEVRNLSNRFGKQVVHEHLSLEVMRGEILGVVGGSGSGKSVLLRSIAGLRKFDAGTIRVFGSNLAELDREARMRAEERMGILFQRGALFSSLSVLDNVTLPLVEHTALGRSAAEKLARVKLALVGLPPDAVNKAPASLSGGMIKRVALARALALDPEILFLDEPTSGLDPVSASAFDQLLHTLRDALGLTVFLVTHDLDTLCAICDRVAVLSQRCVIAAGPLPDVANCDDPWIAQYFHGPRGRAALAAMPQLRMGG
nr:ATP-binding cassette domain-containing protein [Paraburkholderia oxyphila]